MKRLLLLTLVFAFLTACTYDKGAIPKKETVCDTISYTTQIVPIINNYCISCHVYGGPGTGDFSDYNGVKLKADNGTLKNRVVDLKDMPQAGSPALSDDDRQKIECWIRQGAQNN